MPVLKRAVAAMRRRKFIKLFGGAAFTWPVVARAEQLSAIRRLGILLASSEGEPQTLAGLSLLSRPLFANSAGSKTAICGSTNAGRREILAEYKYLPRSLSD
jgi:hypothetical protein